MKLKQRRCIQSSLPLTRGGYPYNNMHRAITGTSTQQQTVQINNISIYATQLLSNTVLLLLPSVAISSRNRCIPPRSRRSLGGQRRPPLHDLTRTCAANCLSALQVNHLRFSRRLRHALVFSPLCRCPPATTKPWNPIHRCLATEVTLASPAGDAANGIQL